MTRDLVIIGCGGFGREVVGIVDAINASTSATDVWNLIGFLDDSPSERDAELVARLPLSILGPINSYSINSQRPTYFVVGIGSGSIRRAVAERAESIGLTPTILIHPNAAIGRDVRIGNGSIVAAHSQVTTNVTLGKHVHVDRSVQIGHDTEMGNFSTAHPMAVVSGRCQLGEETELGTNCTLLPGVKVGSRATVGAGACVVKDVEAGQIVKGLPAR